MLVFRGVIYPALPCMEIFSYKVIQSDLVLPKTFGVSEGDTHIHGNGSHEVFLRTEIQKKRTLEIPGNQGTSNTIDERKPASKIL